MRKSLIGFALLFALAARAQVTNPVIVPVTVAPSGTCTASMPLQLLVPAGILYSCQNGTWGALTPASNFTPAACLAATTVTSPCIAYQGTFTALGVSGTTGVQALYASNAPANASFQVCPAVTINTAGSAGSAVLQVSFTTPGGTTRATSSFLSVALTSTGNQIGGCSSVTTGANSSFSFAVLAVSGTGTPVWETEPVVMRIH